MSRASEARGPGLWARLWSPIAANPVLSRELGAMARRGRAGWAVLVLTVAVTLVIASVGGQASETNHPGLVGAALYQAFFTLMHALALVAGPAIAAGSIASEREGRTLEALLLTGLSPGRIAVGKTLAAVAHVGTYAVALAPVGALPFLFGGVPAAAVPFAFAQLAVLTTLAAMLGLAVSAKVRTTRAALFASVTAGAALAFGLYTVVGEGFGNAVARDLGLANPGAMWLPLLLASGALPLAKALPILGALALASLLLGWFLFAACVAGLSDGSSDRAGGLKRWYVSSALLGTAVMAVGVLTRPTGVDPLALAVEALGAYAAFALFGSFVFAGDDPVAPRRVRLLWDRDNVGALRRFFGPGLRASATLQIGCAALCIGAIAGAGLLRWELHDEGGDDGLNALAATAVCTALWTLAAVGTATWLRARFRTATARTVLALGSLVLVAAPFAASSILGGSPADPDSLAPWLAAPSPLFAFEAVRSMLAGTEQDDGALRVAMACAAALGAVGTIALARGATLASRQVRDADEASRARDRIIDAEDSPEKIASEETKKEEAKEPPTSEPAAQERPEAEKPLEREQGS